MLLHYAVLDIVGADYQDGRIESLKVGDELVLCREPSNPHDRNAVYVTGSRVGGLLPVGYMPAAVARRLAPEIDAGRVFKAVYAGDLDFPQMVIMSAGDGGGLDLSQIPGGWPWREPYQFHRCDG